MRIKNMLCKDIGRELNGVVKAAQDDERCLISELEEFIVTEELSRHFARLFGAYERSLRRPTEEIGVWISGFFGSGKSHFLKMLSYLFSHETIGGKRAIEYFKGKLGDPELEALVRRSVENEAETILFNIDVEGPAIKDKTAILRVFSKLFDRHCGFVSEDPKLARLERFIDEQGKTAEFRNAFREIHGAEWTEVGEALSFFEDDIVETLRRVLGWSEQAARGFLSAPDSGERSIARLVSEIDAYVRSKGDGFRLLFFVDEIGQYVGEDGDLLLNLQSLVEEIGARCGGRVWVFATAQESLDETAKGFGNDFSKILGRFHTRLGLTSSSVDEVIRKRLLEKTEEAKGLLGDVYEENRAVLKNLFAFRGAPRSIRGFSSEKEFIDCYPFVPYQFTLLPRVFSALADYEHAGRYLSSGERSMLSAFRDAALRVSDSEERRLVPFDLFFDTLSPVLDSSVRETANRAARGENGVLPEDLGVLKALYLLRHLDELKANADNLAALMISEIDEDKLAEKRAISGSLERLTAAGFVSRSGDTYRFLTADEQELERAIREMTVEPSAVSAGIAAILFGDLYPVKKLSRDKREYRFDRVVDGHVAGTAGNGMRLRFITVASEEFDSPDEKKLIDSSANREAIFVLEDAARYYDEIEEALKIEEYTSMSLKGRLSAARLERISEKRAEAVEMRRRAREYLEQSIAGAKCFVCGERARLTGSGAKERIDQALAALVDMVYDKKNRVVQGYDSDQALLSAARGADAAGSERNREAAEELALFLQLRAQAGERTSLAELLERYEKPPYGWERRDTLGLVLTLWGQRRVKLAWEGRALSPEDPELLTVLRDKKKSKQVEVLRHVGASEELVKKTARFLREYLRAMDIPREEERLTALLVSELEKRAKTARGYLESEYSAREYPGREETETALALLSRLLEKKDDGEALMKAVLSEEDALLDSAEDMEQVDEFFQSQRKVYDRVFSELSALLPDEEYFAEDGRIQDAMKRAEEIRSMRAPYGAIGELPRLSDAARAAHAGLLKARREEARELFEMETELSERAKAAKRADLAEETARYFDKKREEIEGAVLIRDIDAAETRIRRFFRRIERELGEDRRG